MKAFRYLSHPYSIYKLSLRKKGEFKIEPVSMNHFPADLQRQIVQANASVKKFGFHSFLKLMLLAVSSQKESLRDIEAGLLNPQLQKELAFESISHSQISRALRGYDAAILKSIFFYLISLIHLEEKGLCPSKAFIIDSTTFPLNKTQYLGQSFARPNQG